MVTTGKVVSNHRDPLTFFADTASRSSAFRAIAKRAFRHRALTCKGVMVLRCSKKMKPGLEMMLSQRDAHARVRRHDD